MAAYGKRALPEGPALITVVVATYNAASTLETALDSILDQSYENVELIVIDGGSADRTVDILRKYDSYIDYWLSESDHGLYDAWNKAVRLAHGEYIGFLGADDRYLPGALASYASYIASCPNRPEYVSSQVRLTTEGGVQIRVLGEPWTWPRFQKRMTTAHVGSLTSRGLFQELGPFDTALTRCADYEFLLRRGDRLRAAYVAAVTAEMRYGGRSTQIVANVEQFIAKRRHVRHRLFQQGLELSLALAKHAARVTYYALRYSRR